MGKKPSIAIVGAGNLAAVLVPALTSAGYRIDEVVARSPQQARRLAAAGARTGSLATAPLQPAVIWICVTDDAIAAVARKLAGSGKWDGKIVLHSSGALTSDDLSPLSRRGAAVASLHPMMTFVAGTSPSLDGVSFAVEGDPAAVRVARRIARDLKGNVFTLKKEAKVLYHALGSFSSPMLIATLVTAERVARAAGISRPQAAKIMRPIVRRTIENYLQNGAAAAFSGPINRGDIATVRKHLLALKKVPGARAIYVALARSVLEILPVRRRSVLARLLR